MDKIKAIKQFKGELHCLGENTGKYKTFSVPLVKEVENINKNVEEINILQKPYLTIAFHWW